MSDKPFEDLTDAEVQVASLLQMLAVTDPLKAELIMLTVALGRES